MSLILSFLAGMFIVNGLPHLIKGVTGQTHLTPFKKVSNSYINVLWSFSNFILGIILLSLNPTNRFLNLPRGDNLYAFFIGVFVMAMMCAWLFSKPNAKMPWQKD